MRTKTSQGHQDVVPELEVQPRWPKRKPRPLWIRVRLLLAMAVLWGLLFWYTLSSVPILSVHDGLIQTLDAKWWLETFFALELLRQLHYWLCEHSGWWNHLWVDDVVVPMSRRTGRLSDWARFRFKRILAFALLIALIAIIAGAAMQENPITALFALPGQAVSFFGVIVPVIILMFVGVSQFVAIFWFMSRGGVEVYYPDDVKTRFTDVWGQDAVLARVKEAIFYLEDPESIESKGGYVPGGILLWGPPGTGKTLMAEAVAGETGRPFVFVDPGAFQNMFVGVGVLKVKGLFRRLRKLALRYGGVIAFFDEADSLGSRGALAGGMFPGGGRTGASPFVGGGPWATSNCHGGTYLSDGSVSSVLTYNQMSFAQQALAPMSAPDERRRVRDGGMAMGMGGNTAGMGTLQALLAEMSGLKKPKGFMNRVVRRGLSLAPKAPPKYRMLFMMATNMPDSLDEALLRPGRIDRIYRVGYPSKAGRVRTYEGYFAKVAHELTVADLDKLATITPYATGATIKDLVNESLIVSLRNGHQAISWADVLEAKRLKDLGPSEEVEYVERERHAVAIHEACHAVVAYRVRKHLEIDLATIEKGGTYLGMVSSIKPEDRFTSWRSEYEADVMVSLASLAGERYFFAGDSSSGCSGDLESATTITGLMEGYWGMGNTVASQAARRAGAFPTGEAGMLQGEMGKRVEERLHEMLDRTAVLVEQNKASVYALAHALESHRTLSGEDVEAVIEGRQGRGVDGSVYSDEHFVEVYDAYHQRLLTAHLERVRASVPLPVPSDWMPQLVGVTAPAFGSTGNGVSNGLGHTLPDANAGDDPSEGV